MGAAQKILVVDDERSIADTLAAIMQLAGYECAAAYNAEEALAYLRTEEASLIISDVIMPGANGVELAVQVRRRWPKTHILLVSGNGATQDILQDASAEGHTFEILAKPVLPNELLMKVFSLVQGGATAQHVRAARAS